jgi:uncharacterized protein (TIGR03067 family)
MPPLEYDMRFYIVGLVLLTTPVGLFGNSPDEPIADRVARLVKQLGNKDFAKREAASKELDAIGEPALGALNKAASSSDAEIQSRATKIVRAVTVRLRAAVTKKELEKLQGAWSLVSYEKDGKQIKGEDKSHAFIVKGDRWSTYFGGQLFQAGTVTSIEVKERLNAIDLLITAGNEVGGTAKSIYAVKGDSLYYLLSGEPRATDFTTKPGDGRHYAVFRRVKVGAPWLPEIRFESAAFSTDLLVPESKQAIHRVALKCRLADGEVGALSFDPTNLKFDAFGDSAPGGNLSPLVTLDCTLKLIKFEKDRQLYELRGPKVVSHFSLVAYKSTTAGGDGRLLVHGPGGETRYVIDLSRPELRFPPCHPGCFPAATRVLVPRGTTAIERIHKGDLVTAIDAAGKLAPAKVAEVFVTRNRVLEVRTTGGALVTTATQPVGLEKGGFRAAGELKPGDRVWRWSDGKRSTVTVTAVTRADREVEVFNLILGEPTGFVAGGFLVRSKPPAVPQP